MQSVCRLDFGGDALLINIMLLAILAVRRQILHLENGGWAGAMEPCSNAMSASAGKAWPRGRILPPHG
jgi:hypothetical protein